MSPLNFEAVLAERPAYGRLQGKIALVTGVARPRGVGNAIAKLFCREGATVIATDIAPEVHDCVAQLKASGGKAEAMLADLSKLDNVEAMVAKIKAKYGRIDILCNVAGKSVPPRPALMDMTADYWHMVLERNLTTAFNCCKAVVPLMVEQNYGKIVNLGSTTGSVTVYRYCAAYAASKGAVAAFSKALALELGEYNITVNTIMPGDVDTGDEAWKPGDTPRDLSLYDKRLAPPIARPVRSEEVADMALFLSTDDSRMVTGADMLIDGGFTTVEAMPTGPQ